MLRNKPWLNHGGTSADNPILSGAAFTIRLSKQDSSETLKKCYVVTGKVVFKSLTNEAIETDYDITVPVIAGTHLKSGSTPQKNVIHFTTTSHRHARAVVWVADVPPVFITLDGYNANDPDYPLIYPLYQE